MHYLCKLIIKIYKNYTNVVYATKAYSKIKCNKNTASTDVGSEIKVTEYSCFSTRIQNKVCLPHKFFQNVESCKIILE
jgi:hypothetical protein